MLLLAAEGPVGVPVVGEADGAEIEDGVWAGLGPAHAGLLHTILDKVTAGALDDAGADGPATGEVLVVAHEWGVAPVVADGGGDGLAPGPRACRVSRCGRERGDDRFDLPPQERQQVAADPGGALGVALAEQGVAGRPEVFDS